jgi:hypothetical protein
LFPEDVAKPEVAYSEVIFSPTSLRPEIIKLGKYLIVVLESIGPACLSSSSNEERP